MNSYYNRNNSSSYSGGGASGEGSGYRGGPGYGGGGGGDKKQNRRVAQEELTQKKMEKETEFFWNLVERNKKQPNRRMNSSSNGEEKKLFGAQGNAGIKFDSYESIPVEKSGPHADAAPPMNSFDELTDSLPEFMISNLQRMKYDVPTPIQKYAIPLALLGHDLMCSAQTGSGKTCAFLFPMITSLGTFITSLDPSPEFCRHQFSIDERGVHPLAVVLAPTRELAAQIHLESKKICFGSQLRSLVLYGGSDIRSQLSELSSGCDIIIATPGRMIDIIDRGIISLSDVKCLILDEADRMLDMGFEPQIREIVQYRDMPGKEDRQTLMFSATFKPDIQKLASEFLVDYVWIGVGRVGSTVENIKQNIILSTPEASVKLQLTVDAINSTPGRTLIFVQMKRTAAWLSETLRNEYQIRVDDIHSDKSQMQREASLRRFRDGQVRVLVGTDVAARGLDIPDVAHVIQYDLPHTPDEFDSYVHRVGRTGRAGHVGQATSLFVPGTDSNGNSRIAPLILRLLEETEQDIPEWFRSMAQQRMPSGGSSRGRKNWGNGNHRSGGGSRGSGGGGGNYRNNSQQQYYQQNYSSYQQPTAADSYENYDYGSDYVGDYRYSPYAAMDRTTPQYYEPRPPTEYSGYNSASRAYLGQSQAHNPSPSSLPLQNPLPRTQLLQPSTTASGSAMPAASIALAAVTVTAPAARDNNSVDSGESLPVANPPAIDPKRNATVPLEHEDVAPVRISQRANIQRSHEPNASYDASTYAPRTHPNEAQYQYYAQGSPQMEYYAARPSIVSGLPQQQHSHAAAQPFYPSSDGYQMGYAPNWRPQQSITVTHPQQNLYSPPAAPPSQYHHTPPLPPPQGYYPESDPSRGYHHPPSMRGHPPPPPQGGGEYGPNATGYPPSYPYY